MTIRMAWSLAGGALAALLLTTFSDSDAATRGLAGNEHPTAKRGGGRPGGGGGARPVQEPERP